MRQLFEERLLSRDLWTFLVGVFNVRTGLLFGLFAMSGGVNWGGWSDEGTGLALYALLWWHSVCTLPDKRQKKRKY